MLRLLSAAALIALTAGCATLQPAATQVRPAREAIEAFRRSGAAVGQMLASCGALLDLDVVAIGGGLINAGPLLMEPLMAGFQRHSGFGFVKRLEIVEASAGQNAGILGAAALVAGGDKYWTPPQEAALGRGA